MRTFRKLAAGATLGLVMSGAWLVGESLFSNVQFARAQQQVDATRAQIANVQDMAAVFKSIDKVLEPSVVQIDVEKTVTAPAMRFRGQMPRWFDPNGNADPNGNGNDAPESLPFDTPRNQLHQQGTGSGVIMETDGKVGYIVTNNHVAGDATNLIVRLSDNRVVKNAKVVGTDPKSDLAVVKIEADHLIAAKWGDSNTLEKGDIIVAFGSPFGYIGSMTHGIVSALNRRTGILANRDNPYGQENFIQVDAPINPGNSGGPLVDLHGNVVGINTAIATDSGSFAGIGFAIPSNQAKYVFDAIKTKGRVARGWLGVEIGDMTNPQIKERAAASGYTDDSGVLVSRVIKGAPAFGKLQPDDIVTAINGTKVKETDELRNTIASLQPDSDVKLSVIRNGKPEEVIVRLKEQPGDVTQVSSAADSGRPGNTQTSPNVLGLRVTDASNNLLKQYGLDQDVKGAVVTAVRPGSLAQRAELTEGDCITSVNSTPVNSAEDLNDALSKVDLKKGFTLHVSSKESVRSVYVKAEEE